jgi:hypothetical protein
MILFLFPATKHDCCFLLPHPNMSIHHSSIYPLPQKSLLLALGHHPRNDEEKKITMEEKNIHKLRLLSRPYIAERGATNKYNKLQASWFMT